jgi:hypothetical protein
MKRAPCNGAECPTRPDDVFFIEPIKANAKFSFITWSPAVWGMWTHFHESTSACYENHTHCVEQHDPKTLRFKGYLFGYHMVLLKAAFLQITPACVRALIEQLPDGSTLRGLQLNIVKGQKRNSPVKIGVDPYMVPDESRLRSDLSPRPSIYHMWKEPDPGWKWATNPTRGITEFRVTG